MPDGLRVYAIGDIHGRVDLLREIDRLIIADAASAAPPMRKLAVYLGDCIDRGLQSREVIDLLLDEPLPGFETIHLRGNHDHELLAFLEDPQRSAAWLRYGGDATIYSYGVRLPSDLPPQERLSILRDRLQAALPPRHVTFSALPQTYESATTCSCTPASIPTRRWTGRRRLTCCGSATTSWSWRRTSVRLVDTVIR